MSMVTFCAGGGDFSIRLWLCFVQVVEILVFDSMVTLRAGGGDSSIRLYGYAPCRWWRF